MRSSFQHQPALIYIYCLFGWLLTSRGLYATTMVSSFLPPAQAAKACHPPPVQLPQRFYHNLSHSKLPKLLSHKPPLFHHSPHIALSLFSHNLGYSKLPRLAILLNPSCSILTAAGWRLLALLLQVAPPPLTPPPDTEPGPFKQKSIGNRNKNSFNKMSYQSKNCIFFLVFNFLSVEVCIIA